MYVQKPYRNRLKSKSLKSANKNKEMSLIINIGRESAASGAMHSQVMNIEIREM